MEKFICLMTDRKIVGMDVCKLLEENTEAVNCNDVSWDFSLDLTDNYPLGMCHFTLDSKIYMVGGVRGLKRNSYFWSAFFDKEAYCNDIYHFDLDLNNRSSNPMLELSLEKSFTQTPVTLFNAKVAYVWGDIYFIQHHTEDDGLLILKSTNKEWEHICFHPDLLSTIPCFNDIFVLDNKLFIHEFPQESHMNPLYCFNHHTKQWEVENNEKFLENIMNSFRIELDNEPQFCFPKITVSVPGFSKGSSIMLSWYFGVRDGTQNRVEEEPVVTLTMLAYLVNQTDVTCYQPIEEVFEFIQPGFVRIINIFFLDLGDSTMCALVYGIPKLSNVIAVCISIFTLAKANDFINPITGTSPKKERFLTVRVLRKHVYNLSLDDIVFDAFVFHKTKHPYSKTCLTIIEEAFKDRGWRLGTPGGNFPSVCSLTSTRSLGFASVIATAPVDRTH